MNTGFRRFGASMGRLLLVMVVVVALVLEMAQPMAAGTQVVGARQFDIAGAAGSEVFGTTVTVLPNGNIVVTDPYYDAGATEDVGTVYLYDGATGALISTLTGSTAHDAVGWNGVTVLSNGNYVVVSEYWHNGPASTAGAVTWGSGTTGISGVVSASNSLVGSTDGDWVGTGGVVPLSDGNYVVVSYWWNNGPATNAGAVTWGNGTTGVSGVVSAANSLVGSTADDQVGHSEIGSGVMALSNGNYVVRSPDWDNGAEANAGAVTWGNGTTGVSGVVSAANSLVGSTTGDTVGFGNVGVIELSNGNYVVCSSSWDNGAIANVGAVTWGNGTTGTSGPVSAANSLVGSTADDGVGLAMPGSAVTALSNGNYVVRSHNWDNGAVVNAGAVTWGDGTTGTVGPVSPANSLVGSTAYDLVGRAAVTALSNGNYVASSPDWNNGSATSVGAVTWGNGTTGTSGVVSAANSLVGGTTNDVIGAEGVAALNNGNYVAISPYYDRGTIVNAGAVTWGDGTTGTSGVVSEANSLVGGTADDRIGYVSLWDESGVMALSNGNYLLLSPWWDNGAAADAGAVTWGNGMTGVAGPVSAANSLVGTTADDQVGYAFTMWTAGASVTELSNGNYVVCSPQWDKGAIINAGAATWGNGTTGIAGPVSAANSLVGTAPGDLAWVTSMALSNGNYVVRSPNWGNGSATSVGAVTWGNGTTGTSGVVSVTNSLAGSTTDDQVGYGYDAVTPLSNGNYVVASYKWDNGAIVDAGAVTWGNGTKGSSGVVSATNSLVGSTADDQVGYGGEAVTPLSNGNYVVPSYKWDNGAIVDAGAVTWGNGATGTRGPITEWYSVRGTSEAPDRMPWAYDPVNHQLVVGRPADNVVTLLRLSLVNPVFLPLVIKAGP